VEGTARRKTHAEGARPTEATRQQKIRTNSKKRKKIGGKKEGDSKNTPAGASLCRKPRKKGSIAKWQRKAAKGEKKNDDRYSGEDEKEEGNRNGKKQKMKGHNPKGKKFAQPETDPHWPLGKEVNLIASKGLAEGGLKKIRLENLITGRYSSTYGSRSSAEGEKRRSMFTLLGSRT